METQHMWEPRGCPLLPVWLLRGRDTGPTRQTSSSRAALCRLRLFSPFSMCCVAPEPRLHPCPCPDPRHEDTLGLTHLMHLLSAVVNLRDKSFFDPVSLATPEAKLSGAAISYVRYGRVTCNWDTRDRAGHEEHCLRRGGTLNRQTSPRGWYQRRKGET